eukprot:2784566-Rhodomonas_salina.1
MPPVTGITWAPSALRHRLTLTHTDKRRETQTNRPTQNRQHRLTLTHKGTGGDDAMRREERRADLCLEELEH